MSAIKFSPDLHLGPNELKRWNRFLVDDGYKRNLLNSTVSFGLIKSNKDLEFKNAKVSIDSDVVVNSTLLSTLKINPSIIIDRDGNLITSPQVNKVVIQNDGQWYWVRVSYKITHEEVGTYTLSSDGSLTGVGGELTKILTGKPNFPSKIKIINSVNNTSEYEILEVINDNNVILNGVNFFPERDLKISVIGTFTPLVAVPTENKEIYNYDSIFVDVVQEVNLNTPPTTGFVQDKTFYLARVRMVDKKLIVQDKRVQYWEAQGAETKTSIDNKPNLLVGVESINYQHDFSPKDKNVVNLSWGLKSSNWTLDSTLGILTIQEGRGGIIKSVNDTISGMFTGWRVYTSNGKYARVYNSVKQGQAINLYLDILNIDNYSTDGGTSFITQEIIVVPDCEQVEFLCTPLVSGYSLQQTSFSFPVNTRVGKCELVAYLDPISNYNIKYRLNTGKEFTEYSNINNDQIGYVSENGSNKLVIDGNVELQISPNAFKNFVSNIDKGDLKGVITYTELTQQNYDLIVGSTPNYIHIRGSISLIGDLTFNLKTQGAVNGSTFTIHLDCTDFNLNNSSLAIINETFRLKEITQGDIWQMQNQNNGIAFTCTFDGTRWVIYQNYDLGTKYELKTFDGVVSELFDSSTGLGKIRGFYGYAICNGTITNINGIVVPDLRERFIVGQSLNIAPGKRGGTENIASLSKIITLTEENLPEITLRKDTVRHGNADNNSGGYLVNSAGNGTMGVTQIAQFGGLNGNAKPITLDFTPAYYSVIFAKKLF